MDPRVATVEELHERTKLFGAILASPKMLPRNPGQIDDRDSIGGFRSARERAVHHATHPNRRTTPGGWIETTQLDEFRKLLLEEANGRRELSLRVGPKDRDRRGGTIDSTAGGAHLLAEVMKNRCHFFSLARRSRAAFFAATV
jgi:hypothetical protein